MGVLDQVDGLTVSLQVSADFQEYLDEDDTTPSRVSKYVESQTGVPFLILCLIDALFSTKNKSIRYFLLLIGNRLSALNRNGQKRNKKGDHERNQF